MSPDLHTGHPLFWIGTVLYALSFLFALVSISSEQRLIRSVFMTLLAGGFLFQSLGLYFRGIEERAFPLTNPFEILQVLSWSAVCVNLILRPLFRLSLLNFFSAGLATLLGALSLANLHWDYNAVPTHIGSNPWVGFHAVLAVFSYGVFGVLAITSLMYLIQNYGLNRRRAGALFSLLPAIRQLEDINSKLIVFGVSVLTVSVAIGCLNWIALPGTIGALKLSVAIAVWAAYLVLLFLRNTNRLIASPFARACVILFVAALVSLWPLMLRTAPETPATGTGMYDDASR
ncbi:cytochrome c biogenesis protein CcsA [Ruficoccus amylovorans]|uniref:Cytochrome c biogenesis protein CcsA n=1 Tax=Ruficoccus amylovorans TaxID=1804625 RepID=A0A842HCK5_9BACT|nr:cytochrome c biogenesis protein CcsA [Ruficoccus amylovorans]MBC2593980.1 cytochrome c biogenesis protein CcsA [Ruficoccus amylovorans]